MLHYVIFQPRPRFRADTVGVGQVPKGCVVLAPHAAEHATGGVPGLLLLECEQDGGKTRWVDVMKLMTSTGNKIVRVYKLYEYAG